MGSEMCIRDRGSYVAQLYDILLEHMDQLDVRRCKHMHSARVFRDFLVDWVFYWQNVLPPFIPRRSPKTQWTAEDWEKRHMHEIDDPEDKIQKLPLSVGDVFALDMQTSWSRELIVFEETFQTVEIGPRPRLPSAAF